MTSPTLTEEDALRAFARMMHTLSVAPIEPLLHDLIHYEAQWNYHTYAQVWCPREVATKEDYIAYIKPRLERIRSSGIPIYAEMGRLPEGPCVILAEGSKDALAATAVLKVVDGKIIRLEVCTFPSPHDAERTGEYPE